MQEERVLMKPSKVRVALALVRHPAWWPEVLRRVRFNIGRALLPPPMGQDRRAASAWAKEAAVNETTLFQKLELVEGPNLAMIHPTLLIEAAAIESASAKNLGGGASAELIFRVCEAMGARTAVETGVAHGWSSLAMLASIASRGGRVFSVDMPHPLLGNAALTGAIVPASLRGNWTLIREPDHTGLTKVLRQVRAIDFIHYDSDKSYDGRAATYRRLWDCLRPGGIFMSDDIGDNTAFRDFAVEVGVQPIVVHALGIGLSGTRYVGFLRKS